MRKPNPVVGDDKVDLAKEKPHAKDKIASGRQSARALYVAVHLGYQKLTLEVRPLRWSGADWREQDGKGRKTKSAFMSDYFWGPLPGFH